MRRAMSWRQRLRLRRSAREGRNPRRFEALEDRYLLSGSAPTAVNDFYSVYENTPLLIGPMPDLSVIAVNQGSNDLGYDPASDTIFVSVPSNASTRPGTITPINPHTGALGNSVAVAGNPGTEAVAPGAYVYTVTDGGHSVQRVNLLTQTGDLKFSMPGQGTQYAQSVKSLSAIPGRPDSVLISAYYRNLIPPAAGTNVWKNGVALPHHVGAGLGTGGPDISTVDETGLKAYGYQNTVTSYTYWNMGISDQGVENLGGPSLQNILTDFNVDRIAAGGNKLFTDRGDIYDLANPARIGSFTGGAFTLDPSNQKFFSVTTSGTTQTIHIYSMTTLQQTDTLVLNNIAGSPASLVRFGSDGLAFRTGNQVILVESNKIFGSTRSGVLQNDIDVDNPTLAAHLVSDVQHGSLTLNADGTFSYVPNAHYTGTDTFTYQANDGALDSNVATATITVNHAPPVAVNDAYSTNQAAPLIVSAADGLLHNDSDPDGLAFTAALVAAPAHGSVTLNADGSFTYTPNANFFGADGFAYKDNDGLADSRVAAVAIAVNDFPVAVDDSYTVAEYGTLVVSAIPGNPRSGVLLNDIDVDNPTLTASLVSDVQHGSLTLNADGTFTYVPNSHYIGADSFTYKANDGSADSNVATATITVTHAPPVVANDAYSIDERTVLAVSAADGVLKNDADLDNLPMTAVLVGAPAHGSATLNSDGSFTYTPGANFFGTDTFTYKANNGFVNSSVSTVTLTVNFVNHVPVAVDDAYTTNENTPLVLNALPALSVIAVNQGSNDLGYDPASDTIYVSVSSNASTNPGTITPINPHTGVLGSSVAVAGSPGAEVVAPGAFVYTVTDDGHSVQRVNLLTQTGDLKFSMPGQGTQFAQSVKSLSAIPGRPDSVLISMYYPGSSPPAGGTNVWKNGVAQPDHVGAGLGTGGPDISTVDETGLKAYGYQNSITSYSYWNMGISDQGVENLGGPSLQGILTGFNVGRIAAGGNKLFTDRGDIYDLANPARIGSFTGGAFTLDPSNQKFFSITTSGTTQTIHIYSMTTLQQIDTLVLNNIPGSAASLVRFGSDGLAFGTGTQVILVESNKILGTPRSGVLQNDIDVDNPTLTAQLVSDVQHGSLTLNADGTFTYVPNSHYIGTDRFTYKANDGSVDSNVATATITITHAPPVAADDAYSTDQRTSLVVPVISGVLRNDTDLDGLPLTAALVAAPAHGSLTLNADGSFTYTPNTNFFGTDTFAYKANNGFVNSNVSTVTLTVNFLNDVPVAVDDAYTTNENTPLVFNALPALSVIAVNQGSNDLGYDPVSDTIFVSVPSNASTRPGTITPINPHTGALGNSVAVAGNPGNEVVAPGAYVYTVTDGGHSVQRVNLLTQSGDLNFSMPGQGTQYAQSVKSLSAIPGRPDSVLISMYYPGFSPPAGGTNVWQNGVAQPDHVGSGLGTGGPDISTVDETGLKAYGYQNTVTGYTYWNMGISDQGVENLGGPSLQNILTGFNVGRIAAGGNKLFTDRGDIYDLANPARIGSFTGGTFTLDPSNQKFFSITSSGTTQTIHIYSMTTLQQIDTLVLNNIPGSAASLVCFGLDGLAFRAGNQVILVESNRIFGHTRNGVLQNDIDVDDPALTAHLVSNVQHGSLTLNADGSFSYVPNTHFSGTDSFTYRANDGLVDSNLATVTITVNHVPPVAVNDAYSTNQAAPLIVSAADGLLHNDSDPDGLAFTAALVAAPAHGSVTLNADGSFAYTPNANFFGTDGFTYKINDGLSDSSVAAVVIAVNDRPVAVDDSYTMTENATLVMSAIPGNPRGGVLLNDIDVDNPTLTAHLVGDVRHGSLTLNSDGTFTYIPNSHYQGADSFTYQANDGSMDSNVVTATISITHAPPVSANDAYSTDQRTSLVVPMISGVLRNDTDLDGLPLTAALVAAPAHGSLTLNANGSFTYTPSANFFGTDTFAYKANDGLADSNVATVTLTVNFVNDVPAAVDDAYTTNESTPLVLTALPALSVIAVNQGSNDLGYDPVSDTIFVSVPSNASTRPGTITPINPHTGALGNSVAVAGNPGTEVVAPGAYVYTVTDGGHSVQRVNLLTQTGDLNFSMPGQGTQYAQSVKSLSAIPGRPDSVLISMYYPGFSPPAGGTNVWKNGVAQPDHVGSGLGTGGPDISTVDETGLKAYGYQNTISGYTYWNMGISDQGVENLGGPSLQGILTGFNVGRIAAGGNKLFTDRGDIYDLANPARIGSFTGGAFTLDPSNQKFFSITTSGTTQTIHIYSMTNLQQIDTLVLNNIAGSAASLVRFGSDGLAFRAGNQVILVESNKIFGTPRSGVLQNDIDVDNPTLTAHLVSDVQHGSLTLNANGTFSYVPNLRYTGTDSFTYRANDGTVDSNVATVTITVIHTPPVAVDDGYTASPGTPLTISAANGVLKNDTDVDHLPLSAMLVTGPSHGLLSFNSDGSFTYTSNANFTGSDSFTYRASAGGSNSNLATVTITANDAPVAVNDAYTTNEDAALAVTGTIGSLRNGVLQNDIDQDDPTLTAVLVAGPAHGLLALSSDGTFTYVPNPNFNGTETFTYKANDGLADSNVATVTITINAVNDPPSFTKGPDQSAINGAGPQTISGWATNISAGPPDESPQALNFVMSNNNPGLFSAQPAVAANGTLTFTPLASAFGSATVTVQLHDSGGTANGGVNLSAVQSFQVMVNPGVAGDKNSPNQNDIFRLVRSGNLLKVFVNNTTATPTLFLDLTTLPQFQVNGLGGNDQLIVDLSGGNPIPVGGLFYDGGTGSDSMTIQGAAGDTGSYQPSGATPGSGSLAIDGSSVSFANLEPVYLLGLGTVTLTTPNPNDVLSITSPTTAQNQVSGTSGGVAIEPLVVGGATTLVLDTGTADAGAGDDSISMDSSGLRGATRLNLQVGAGINSLALQGGTVTFLTDSSGVNLDVTAAGGTLVPAQSTALHSLALTGGCTVSVTGARTLSTPSLHVGAGGGKVNIGTLSAMSIQGGPSALFSIAGGATLTKLGVGTLTITSPQSHGAGSNLLVSAGTTNINTDAGAVGSENLSIQANSKLNLAGTQHVAGLSIGPNTTTTLTHLSGMPQQVLVTGSLTLDPTGNLDLTDGAMIVHGGANPMGAFLYVEGRIANAFHNFALDGLGIKSSTIRDPTLSGLGAALNALLAVPFSKTDAAQFFAGEPAAMSDVLVRYTHVGDANLDGVVNAIDAELLARTYDGGATTGHHWNEGDFTHDGRIDDDDVSVNSGNYNPAAPPPWSQAVEGGTLHIQALSSVSSELEAGRVEGRLIDLLASRH